MKRSESTVEELAATQPVSFEDEYFERVYEGDYFRRNPGYKIRSFLERILLFKKKGRLLDVGCAYGLFLKQASNYFECEGVDISKHALAYANRHLIGRVKLHLGNVESMELERKFDVITCFDVLEHLQKLKGGLVSIKKHLIPGGILVFSVPVYDGVVGRLVELVDKDETHFQKRSRSFWLKTMEKQGFRVLLFEGIFRYFLLNGVYINFISRYIRSFSPAILVVAQK
ncbi:hypothetical protein A2115_01480 [Candidatus Woesebacteria bacterium GWA1_41_8]|uniref:Methyltransferase type 11 domain-containing protein n=1 Tax=Candidatus Woesebacteria bacterium GWA1_41_8 TaxID=1802471 RepID=A0A1F7WH56_9BACT|nr:MAG: hypothetical protein A2115_01480 [Candidatus Woesebacteria bacterium GWA1_41_8]